MREPYRTEPMRAEPVCEQRHVLSDCNRPEFVRLSGRIPRSSLRKRRRRLPELALQQRRRLHRRCRQFHLQLHRNRVTCNRSILFSSFQFISLFFFVSFTGELCQTKIDMCQSSPCQNGATCFDRYNSYVCQCLAGFSGVNCHLQMTSRVTQSTTRIPIRKLMIGIDWIRC